MSKPETVDTVIVIGDGKLVRSETSRAWWDAVLKAAESAPTLTYPEPPSMKEVAEWAKRGADQPPSDWPTEEDVNEAYEMLRETPGGIGFAIDVFRALWTEVKELREQVERAKDEAFERDLL